MGSSKRKRGREPINGDQLVGSEKKKVLHLDVGWEKKKAGRGKGKECAIQTGKKPARVPGLGTLSRGEKSTQVSRATTPP